MKYLIGLIILFEIFSLPLFSQNGNTYKTKIDSLNTLKGQVDSQIERLNAKKKELNNQIMMINNEISKQDLENRPSKKILAIVNFMGGNIYDKPAGNELIRVPTGDTVYVLEEYVKPFFKVIYKNYVGYMSYSSIDNNVQVMEIVNSEIAKTNPKLARLIKKYGDGIANRILKGDYWIGMSSGQAYDSLGYPDKTNLSKGEWGEHEQWIYRSKDLYLYFENGKLTSMQKGD